MTDLFLGLSPNDWEDIYRLHLHEKDGATPRDLWELRRFWEAYPKNTPSYSLRIALKLTEAYSKDYDVSWVRSAIENFLLRKGIEDAQYALNRNNTTSIV